MSFISFESVKVCNQVEVDGVLARLMGESVIQQALRAPTAGIDDAPDAAALDTCPRIIIASSCVTSSIGTVRLNPFHEAVEVVKSRNK
jgi:hypothetical protein